MGATSVVFKRLSRVPSGEYTRTENSRSGDPSLLSGEAPAVSGRTRYSCAQRSIHTRWMWTRPKMDAERAQRAERQHGLEQVYKFVGDGGSR
eukprot:2340980-Prymnesium_polylepis.1